MNIRRYCRNAGVLVGTVLFSCLPAAAAALREELRVSPNDPAARQALAAVLQRAEDH